MKALFFFLLLADMFVTVWMYSLDRWCNDDNNYDLTKVTWYCDQENGKVSCKNSSPFPLLCNNFKRLDVDVVTDQSVLGLQHAGPDRHAWRQIYEMSCIKKKDKRNEPITNVTWHLRQENGKLTYSPSLESCYVHSKDMSSNIGASLTRIRAKVADEDWAGTDCAVKLMLRNRDEPFTCETMALDGAGDNWERDQVEDFKEEDFREEFLPCKHFFPKPGKLQFQFTCSDSMKLAHVELDFGSFSSATSFSSRGLKDLDWTQWTDTWHNLHDLNEAGVKELDIFEPCRNPSCVEDMLKDGLRLPDQ